MKNIIIFLSFFIIKTSLGQQNTCGKIVYNETYTGFDNIKSIYELNFNDINSNYIKIKTNYLNDNMATINGILPPEITLIYNYDSSINEIICQEDVAFEKVVVVDKIKNLNWEILPENKMINDYLCSKAQTIIHNVIYTAWFTSEIPVKYGPWKLRGLPGLILEAYDNDKNYFLTATKIYLNNNCNEINNIIEKNKLNNPITWTEYVEKILNESKDISNFYNSKSSDRDFKFEASDGGFRREIIR